MKDDDGKTSEDESHKMLRSRLWQNITKAPMHRPSEVKSSPRTFGSRFESQKLARESEYT